MDGVRKLLALAGLYLATAPILLAAEPGADDLNSASTRSRDAVEQAQRLSRDTLMNSPTANPYGL